MPHEKPKTRLKMPEAPQKPVSIPVQPDTTEIKPKAKRKVTRKERDERIRSVEILLLQSYRKSEIKRVFRIKYGNYSARQIERYVSLARQRLREDADVDREVMRSILGAQLLHLIRNTERESTKLAAFKQYTDLYGLAAPVRFAQTDSRGRDPKLPDEVRRARIEDQLKRMQLEGEQN